MLIHACLFLTKGVLHGEKASSSVGHIGSRGS